MAKRRRRPPEPGEYEDPLSNYDQPGYEDGLERSLCADRIAKVINLEPFEVVPKTISVREAIKILVDKDIAAVVIVEDERPIGILTERDIQNNIAPDYDALANEPLEKLMTKEPVVVFSTDPPARAMNLMTSGNFRHIPVVDVDGKILGVIGPARLTSYLKKHFTDVPSA